MDITVVVIILAGGGSIGRMLMTKVDVFEVGMELERFIRQRLHRLRVVGSEEVVRAGSGGAE